jgi:hypothetical protein
MILIDNKAIALKLKNNEVSSLQYAIYAFIFLLFYIIPYFFGPPLSFVNYFWIVVNTLIIGFCFVTNKKGDGKNFILRFISICVVSGLFLTLWTFLIMIAFIALFALFAFVMHSHA